MSDSSGCKPSSDAGPAVAVLPTRQKNALRLLLDKASITPEEVAAIDYRILERAPGIGRKSIDLIGAWLNSHGHEVAGLPPLTVNPRTAQRNRKLERAIEYLRWHGYEVRRPE